MEPAHRHDQNGGRPDVEEGFWDSAASLGVTFRAGSPLFGVFLTHAARRGLAARAQEDWFTDADAIELPDAIELCRWQSGDEREALLLIDGTLANVNLRRGRASVALAGKTEASIATTLGALRSELKRTEVAERQEVRFSFSWAADHGVRWMSRSLAVPTWSETATNYPAASRRQLARLMRGYKPGRSGQVIIWHGPPGTGKTNALRALAWEWRDWCSVQVITDPDQLFGDKSGYLLEVVAERPYESNEYRLLVLEDSGEILARDARSVVGQGLGRFLNVCDGLLGQGQKLLVLLTTNEPIGRLHPAIARSGRCAAEIEFPKLPTREANRWLSNRCEQRVARPTALADLYAMVEGRDLERSLRTDGPRIGFGAELGR